MFKFRNSVPLFHLILGIILGLCRAMFCSLAVFRWKSLLINALIACTISLKTCQSSLVCAVHPFKQMRHRLRNWKEFFAYSVNNICLTHLFLLCFKWVFFKIRSVIFQCCFSRFFSSIACTSQTLGACVRSCGTTFIVISLSE